MTITVHELDGTGDVRFSPYCWRTLLALRHKGFHDFERVPVSFRDRSPIAFSNQERVEGGPGDVLAGGWAAAGLRDPPGARSASPCSSRSAGGLARPGESRGKPQGLS